MQLEWLKVVSQVMVPYQLLRSLCRLVPAAPPPSLPFPCWEHGRAVAAAGIKRAPRQKNGVHLPQTRKSVTLLWVSLSFSFWLAACLPRVWPD